MRAAARLTADAGAYQNVLQPASRTRRKETLTAAGTRKQAGAQPIAAFGHAPRYSISHDTAGVRPAVAAEQSQTSSTLADAAKSTGRSEDPRSGQRSRPVFLWSPADGCARIAPRGSPLLCPGRQDPA